MANWKFQKAVDENEECRVDGVNIWNYYWSCVDKRVEVKCPYEGQVYFFKEYQIEPDGRAVHFVAGEFVNDKVGIYVKDDLADGVSGFK